MSEEVITHCTNLTTSGETSNKVFTSGKVNEFIFSLT